MTNTDKVMTLPSSWANITEIYKDEDNFTIITGEYHGEKYLAVHWRYDFPNSFGKLAPCIIANNVAKIMLSGLIDEAFRKGTQTDLEKLQMAYRYIN